MRLPDFLIIGAAKSGTTTLTNYLKQHPLVYIPKKEPNFFGMDERYEKGIEWYAALFDGAKSQQLCGEASTDYTKYPQFPKSAARVAQHIPQVKLVYVMRHPVDRTYSYYVHLGRKAKVKETFEEHIKRTSVSLDGSNYIMQIEQYLKFFPKESFLFILMDDLIQQPVQTIHQVCAFIGIDDKSEFIQENKIAANQAHKFFEDINRARMTKPLKAIPGITAMAALLPQSWRDQGYHLLKATPYGQWINKQYIPPPMRKETRQMLLEKFREPNQRLAEFLNRDLSHWSE